MVDMLLWQDLRYAARSLSRHPVLSTTVAITLLIGIGLSTAIFAGLDGMWFRPRIEKDPDTFVQLLTTRAPAGSASLQEFAAMRERSRTATDFVAWQVAQARIDDDPQSELAQLVTCDFFHFYGLDQPQQGRLFNSHDCAGTSSRVAVITDGLWRARFSSNPAIIGSRIRVNQRAYTVVGIVSGRFAGRLRGGGLWIPYTSQPDFYAGRNFFEEPETPWLIVEGRVTPGHSKGAVEQEMNRILVTRVVATNGSFAQHPGLRTMMLGVVPLISAVMAAILLMACSNVTILLLARASARRREIAIRRALGADRTRLLQMLAAEGVLIASAAGGASAILARWLPAAFRAVFWRAPYYPVTPHGTTFLYVGAATLVAACFAGLAPAVESFRSDLSPALKKQPVFLRPRSRWQMRDLQVGALVALSVVLVSGAVLFVRAQTALSSAERLDVAAQTIAMPLRGGDTAFQSALAERVRTIPGVESVEIATTDPAARAFGSQVTTRYRSLVAVAHGDTVAIARQIGEAARQLDPEQMATPVTVQSEIHELAARFRTISNMIAVLGGIALLLAVVGVYGVVAFAVSQRAQELAIRVALGARRLDVVRAVLDSGFRPIVAGLFAGLTLAVAGGIALAIAFRNAPAPLHADDPVSYLMVCAILVLSAFIAMIRPAWRAGSVDPAMALREE